MQSFSHTKNLVSSRLALTSPSMLALAIGYGLFRGANSLLYASALSSTSSPSLYISDIWFSMTTATAGLITAAIVLLLAWHEKIPDFRLPVAAPMLILAIATLPAIAPSMSLKLQFLFSVMAILYGGATTCVSLAWLELLARQKITHIAGAFALAMIIKSFITLLLGSATGWKFATIVAVLLAISYLLLVYTRRDSRTDKESLPRTLKKRPSYQEGFLGIADAVAVSIVLEAVVSIMSGFFLGISISSESGVSSAASEGAASIVFCFVALAVARDVDVERLYRYLFPILLALVVLLPLSLGNTATEIMQNMLVFVYDFISFSVLYFILRQIHLNHLSTYILAAGVTVLIRLSQLIFSIVGYMLGDVSNNGDGLYWIVIIASVYGLSMLLLYLSRQRSQSAASPIVVTSTEDRFVIIGDKLALQHHLTAREKEIALHLAKGRSASFIANELFCSPATVRTHTKSIYAKLGVHSKQQLINLFS